MKGNLFLGALCVILLGFIFFLVKCKGGEKTKDNDTGSVHHHYHYDSIPKQILVPVLVPGKSIPYSVPANVDTAAILQKYFTANYYKQVLTDSNLVATIEDTVRENKIISRSFTYQWKKPVQHTTIINNPERKKKLFAGFHAGFSRSGISDFGPEVILVTASDKCYKANIDLIDKSIEAGMHWKISFNKKK